MYAERSVCKNMQIPKQTILAKGTKKREDDARSLKWQPALVMMEMVAASGAKG